jgi:hypothetical protein
MVNKPFFLRGVCVELINQIPIKNYLFLISGIMVNTFYMLSLQLSGN